MSETSMTIYEPAQAIAKAYRGNYLVNCGTSQIQLDRGIDFGNPIVKKTGKTAFDQPILLKAGAEKIAFGFGLCQRYTIESKVEQYGEDSFFYYLVRCDLVKISPDGREYVISNGYGSANTKESRNGFKGAADSANGTLKMASKRSLVAAAIAISGLSSIFTQDIENESFMEGATSITQETPESKITSKQIQRIFAIASEAGLNTEQAKQRLKSLGYASTKDITQAAYDAVCEAMTNKEAN